MFVTLFINTFGSSTRVKWGTSRKYNDTALSREHSLSYSNSILYLTSQSTLLKTAVQHFSITYEAVTDTFMLDGIYRDTPTPFSRPHTSTNSRYTTICISNMVLQLGLYICFLDVFENSLKIRRNDFYIYYSMCAIFSYIQKR